MAIKAVIWDFAGVLLHTVKGDFNSTLADRLDVPVEMIERVINSEENNRWDRGEIDDDVFYSFLLQELNLPQEKKNVIASFVVNDFYVEAELLEYIRELRKSYVSVLLTNFPAHLHDFIKTNWIITGAFDHILASCDLKLLKPDPRIYQLALERAGCRAEEAVFIDDREVNIQGAAAVGIPALLYRDTPQVIAELQKILKG